MWIGSVLSKRSGESLDPLKVGLTAGSSSKAALQPLTFSLTATILYLPLTHINLEKEMRFSNVWTRLKKHTKITHRCCFYSTAFLCAQDRLVNEGDFKLHKQTVPSFSRPSWFSSSSSSSPHHSLTLFFVRLLFFGRSFWCCPSDLTQAKQTAEKMPLFFFPPVFFSF